MKKKKKKKITKYRNSNRRYTEIQIKEVENYKWENHRSSSKNFLFIIYGPYSHIIHTYTEIIYTHNSN